MIETDQVSEQLCTVMEFPSELAIGNTPLVYMPNAAGQLEQVNFRQQGTRYVIDLVSPVFELRIGLDKAAKVVRVTRNGSYRLVTCPGAPGCPVTQEGR